jgi:hypothetical protein
MTVEGLKKQIARRKRLRWPCVAILLLCAAYLPFSGHARYTRYMESVGVAVDGLPIFQALASYDSSQPESAEFRMVFAASAGLVLGLFAASAMVLIMSAILIVSIGRREEQLLELVLAVENRGESRAAT